MRPVAMLLPPLTLLLLLGSGSAASIRVDPRTHAFTEVSRSGLDYKGRDIVREVYFHGVNYVRKGAPYIANVVDCDPIGGGQGGPCPPP